MFKILNLVIDDKFIDDIIACHDLLSDTDCQHSYAIITNGTSLAYKYITKKDRIVSIRGDEFIRYLSANHIEAVFLHNLFALPLQYVPQIPFQIKVFWFSWGFDIYRNEGESLIDTRLFHTVTAKVRKKLLRGSMVERLKRLIKYIPNTIRIYQSDQSYVRAIERVDYYSGVLPVEYDLCKQKSYFKASRVEYKYFSPETFSDVFKFSSYTGNNILVGNSAAYENNHLDLLPFLNKLHLNDRKVILPLSYAGSQGYVDVVRREYSEQVGDNVMSLVDYMSFDEYRKVLQGCNVGIFYHERQQALGNVVLLLLMGCKVFMSETSVLYKHFKERGIKVFSVQSELTQTEIDTELDEETKALNVSRLNVGRSKENYIKMMHRLYDHIKM